MSATTDTNTRTSAKAATSTVAMTDLLDHLRRLTDAAGRTDLSYRLDQARARVTDPRLRIVVTGETGQGMTELVDTVVGEFPGAAAVPAPATTAPGMAFELPDANVLFVDTPGVAGLESTAASAVLALLASADAVLFVSDASQEYTEPELAYLARVRELCPTVVGVITKIDQYHRWADIQRANRVHLSRAGLDIPLLPVSAVLHRTGRQLGDGALAVESGVPQLTEFLADRVIGGADTVLRTSVVNDVRIVSDQLAMALNAELDVLNDPSRGAELVARAQQARRAADRLREQTANWQLVLGDGMTELVVDVEHDLRHRLRTLVREAEADIAASDPAPRWETFSEWLDARVTDAVQANFVLAHTGSVQLAERVAARFAEESGRVVPELRRGDPTFALSTVRSLEELESRKAGILQRVISSLRGSYGGVLMVGVATSVAGLALLNPWSIGAGVLLGANTFWEDRKAHIARRQAEAKVAVARLMDDVVFQVGKESKFRLREVQRHLRDHFSAVATELLRSADDAVHAAQVANQAHANRRDARLAEVSGGLSELRQLRVRAAGLVRR
ncbi:MAG TPA: EutP/PduV family microcompartment system protein [Pseudonocardia sp.]|uniref:EutP/PduV family microcompartment system protein n=1 Tax=Pseudonocardia sp. TaxID=60912 RepID=UPI002CEF1858|nr:EutP/PduV family microcompartment system protein [Pseudonocardia sp.]HTF47955.1 EutP/PduV family microcompartment system protein [Pseudonocardia sp.]